MSLVFSTKGVTDRDRFSFWREVVCDAYVQLECNSDAEAFDGELRLHRLPTIAASFVGGSRQHVRRRRRDIGKASEDSFLLSLQLGEFGQVEQGGRTAQLGRGDFALYSATETYDLRLPDGFSQMVVQMPREALLQRLPNADSLTATRISGRTGIGRLVNETVARMIKLADGGAPHVTRCLEDTVMDLLAAGLSSASTQAAILKAPDHQTLLRLKAFLRDRLRDPELSREAAAAHMDMSVRRLNELLQAEGWSLSSLIREMRLQRIAADLRDPRLAGRSISEIAMMWGLNNMQHFSRLFRSRFDRSPRAYRADHC